MFVRALGFAIMARADTLAILMLSAIVAALEADHADHLPMPEKAA